MIFPGEAARCKDELTIPGLSYIVIVWPGWLVTHESNTWFTYVLKWSVDSYVQGVDFMFAVWRKRENIHTILFVVL